MTERANIKQPSVNDGYSKLCGRICTVILTSTHQWNLWARGGQFLKMSVPLSIFIRSCPPPICFVTLLFHLHTTRAAFWCLVPSCPKADEVSLTDILYLFHFSITVTSWEALESVCLRLLSLMYLFHIRGPFCLWGSESNLMRKTQKTLMLHNYNSWFTLPSQIANDMSALYMVSLTNQGLYSGPGYFP